MDVGRGTHNRGRKVAASPRKSLPSAVALETILASFADEISPKLLCLQLLAVTPESLSLLVFVQLFSNSVGELI